MNHNLIYLFGMYEPDTDSIVVYANDSLAQDAPLLYAELAFKADGLQGYVDAINEFN